MLNEDLEPGVSHALTRSDATAVLILFLATMAVYSVTFSHELLGTWDDYDYLIGNRVVQGFTLQNLKHAFSSFFVGNYAPVNIISFMIDHLLWQFHPAGYHAENVVLHALNGTLVYLLLIRLRMEQIAAFLAASVFLFHPVQVETVAWVAERKNLLCMLFFLLTWHCYLGYRRSAAHRPAWYLASLAALALALLSKPAAVIFPFVALLQDRCFPEKREKQGGIQDKVPYLLMAIVVACLALVSQASESGGGRRAYPGGSPLTALFTMMPVLASYLKECFLPLDLLPYYMVPTRQSMDARVVAAALLIICMVAVGAALWRCNRRLFFYYAFFFLALVPVSQIVPLVSLKNDRYLYFPLIGFAGFVIQGLFLLSDALRQWSKVFVVIVALLVLSLPPLAVRQALVWRDDVTLWNYTVTKDPDNMMGWLQLAKAHTTRGNGPAAGVSYGVFRRLAARLGPLRGYENQ